jgi:hypothetical protein
MMGTLLSLALVVAVGADDLKTDKPRQPHAMAPSLPQLTDEEEQKIDAVIDQFIRYDIGQLRGEAARKAIRDFERLGPEAIPGLIRGINRAAAINDSCPATVIASKLGRLLSTSKDIKLLQYARDEIGAGVGPTRHRAVLQDLRLGIMFRRNALVRAGVGEIKPSVQSLRSMSTAALIEAAGKDRGPRLRQVLIELAQRPGDEAIAALGVAAASYERDIQQLAQTLLVRNLSQQQLTRVKEKLKDGKAEVRLAAARVSINRNLPVVNEFIDLLSDEDDSVRGLAHQTLVRVARGTDYGPSKGATKEDCDRAAERWRSWWSRQVR